MGGVLIKKNKHYIYKIKCSLLLYFKLSYWFVTSWSWIYDSKAIKTHMQEDVLTEMDQ